MNVSLTPQLEAMIRAKVASGMYSNASEVVREALRLLAEKDADYQRKMKALRAEIQKGIDAVEAGDVIEYTPGLIQL